MSIKTYSSGQWNWKEDVSIKAKIEYLKERFPYTDKSGEAICIRSLIEEYQSLKQKLNDVKAEK